MNSTEVMRELETLGTAQNRKVYARHGVQGEQYGVSYANLNRLKKQIGPDHDLAGKLWATGNHDARVLATMIGEPERVTAKQLDSWVRDLDDYVVTGAFSNLAAQSPLGRGRMTKWMRARGEWVATTGWYMLSSLARLDDAIPDAEFEEHLATIEATIHESKNRVRHSMNGALIAIGVRNSRLEKRAIAAAKRIGNVEVDHGETSCKTPEAVAYIRRTVAHRRRKK